MEQSKIVAAAVSVGVVALITAGGVGWHDRSVAAEEAATRAAAQAQVAQQVQARADAAEATAQARKLQALDAAQKRVEAGHAAQERDGLRAKAEKVNINPGVPPPSVENNQTSSADDFP